jgi:hypothetical protein
VRNIVSTRSTALHIASTAFALMALTASQAQWLTHTGGGTATTATFSNLGGAYSGTVHTTIQWINNAPAVGGEGLFASSFTNTTPTFNANYPRNSPGNTFEYVSFGYNHTRDAYTVTVDFSGLTNGALPSGSSFAVLDLDIEEDWRDVRAFDSSGLISSPWLSQYAGLKGFLDYNYENFLDQTLTQPQWAFTSDHYDFTGITQNETSGLIGFSTLSDIERITFDVYKHSDPDMEHVGGSGLGIAGVVPEPTTALATLAGILLLGAGRLRPRPGR